MKRHPARTLTVVLVTLCTIEAGFLPGRALPRERTASRYGYSDAHLRVSTRTLYRRARRRPVMKPVTTPEAPPVRFVSPRATGSRPFGPARGRPFAAGSAWNKPIPADPVLSRKSDTQAGYLGSSQHLAQIYRWGVPVFDAFSRTPTYRVTCVRWRPCGLMDGPVPVPRDARPDPADDGHMVVIAWHENRVYEFYEAKKLGSGDWEAGYGTWSRLGGSGHPASTGDARDCRCSLLAGLVRTFEINRGRIDHALVFNSDNISPRVASPARHSSQRSTRFDAIAMGARVQLDPSIHLSRIAGITRAELIVGRALQKYGMYAVDGGGSQRTVGIYFENPVNKPDPYRAVGLSQYHDFPHIPWGRLRVLRSWNGS
jgi:hypothetical protein